MGSSPCSAPVFGKQGSQCIQQIMRDRFNLNVGFGPGSILYKETIAHAVEGIGHFEPLRHYAEAHVLLEPGEPGSGLTFATSCSEDVLARNWQRLILTHFAEKEHLGVLIGVPITDMKLTLLTGRAHEKHTEGGDFRQATYRAIRQGLMTALVIGIHNFPEGIATFMSAIDNPTLGIAIAAAIAIHNIPEGIAVSVPIYYATGSRRKAFLLSLSSGLAEPVGALLAYAVLLPFLSPTLLGCLFGFVAGIMVFISLDELLPAAEEYGEHHISIYGVVTGMALMAVSLIVFS